MDISFNFVFKIARFPQPSVNHVAATASVSFRQPRPVSRAAVTQMKRLGDLLFACALLATTLPLLIVVAVAIKCDSPGPVFDRQPCIASGGRRFQMLKFRTTAHDPEHASLALARRTTRVGRWLRYTRIEMLPQLINLLRGEMSMSDSGVRAPSFLE
jgi:lipopolysaccharide/colanic/teichoic acid biosynthesis glycosyltransferase